MDIKAGDTVYIREWDDMEREYGISLSGSISCDGSFVAEMRNLCGKAFTVRAIEKHGRILFTQSLSYTVTTDMITTTLQPKPKPRILVRNVSQSEINNALDDGYTIREFHKNQCILELITTGITK